MGSRRFAATAAAVLVLLTGCTGTASSESPPERTALSGPLTVEVLNTYPHDMNAFTQGLELRDGWLYESTGQYGTSDVRKVNYESGEVVSLVPLPDDAFGEGLTIVGDQMWQLTWRERYAIRRDLETLEEVDRVEYQGEGWGICHDASGERLVMSNGSARLTFRDPETFEEIGSVTVTRDGEPLTMLNELECVDGQVWANVWQTDEIVLIDPANGQVRAVVDASGLLSESERAVADVLNGIAALPDSDTFLITGKLWPTVFHVRFVPAE
ncbi:MAG TPA: glutaminyl-peptide cyclotransferase [Natronosporangium sp.]|nr:glutaminyl-peptide cyclotransferase [Natronosporangium sp.]